MYRAWNEHLNTMVAIKEYLPEGYSFKAKFSQDVSVYKYGMKKFLQLAELLADIQQPNVVSVHNILQFNGTAYLAMDFVNGTPLSKIPNSSLSLADIDLKQFLRSLLNALHAVHEKNIVHGNINPSNIIIRENREPVLVNFASASIALSEYCKKKRQRNSPRFAYKTRYHPDNHSSPNSDLYSLGASMFFSITGDDPVAFSDRKEALNKNSPDPCQMTLEQIETGLSEESLKTILWMLNPNPIHRAQSAGEVLEKLNQDESDRQKDNIKKLKAEKLHAGLLQYGSAVLIVLMVVVLGYYMQQTAETEGIASDNR